MKIKFFMSLLFLNFSIFAADASDKIYKIIEKGDNILVHVHADWCPSCKVQKKVLDSLKTKHFKVVEVDFDNDKKFLKENRVFQQSMLIAYNNGKEVKRVFGITKKDKIVTFVNDNFKKSLKSKINEKRSGSKVPKSDRMTMEQATEELRKSGIISKALSKGDKYIDFSLPNINGEKIKLSERLKDGPIVLTFYRGGWCPYCNIQLKAYQERLDEIKALGGQLIAISPESMESANTTVEKNEISFEILTDNLNKEARKYGLVFKLPNELKDVYLKFGLDLEKNQGNDSWELPIPATYVISQDGKITYSFLNVDYIQRAEPNDILSALRDLSK